MNGLILLLLTTIPHDDVQRDSVDMIELNHHHDCECRPIFRQFIFWSDDGQRFQVVAWKLEKEGVHFTERPPGVNWVENGQVYQVKGRMWRETFSVEIDQEVEERSVLAKEKRRGLFGRHE